MAQAVNRPQMPNPAAALNQLDNPVGMPIPPMGGGVADPQAQFGQPPQSSNTGVDIARLQPGPMDQLRPRQSNDPAWAPHVYLQKGTSNVYVFS